MLERSFHHPLRGALNASLLAALDPYMHAKYAQRKRALFETARGAVIVELGAGAGANLRYFPRGSHVIALEPNLAMHRRLQSAARRHGGRFVCIEHVRAPPATLEYRIQRVLKRPWRWLFEGCDLCRDTESVLRHARFTEVRIEPFRLDTFVIPIPTLACGAGAARPRSRAAPPGLFTFFSAALRSCQKGLIAPNGLTNRNPRVGTRQSMDHVTNALQSAIKRQRTRRQQEIHMLKIAKLTVALAIAGLAIPAFAQWPKGPSQRVNTAAASAVRGAQLPQSVDGFVYADAEKSGYRVRGFTYRGDGIGWEVAPHKYVFSAGGLAMSDECDHVVRIVKGPTPAEIESGRVLSPGA